MLIGGLTEDAARTGAEAKGYSCDPWICPRIAQVNVGRLKSMPRHKA